MLTLPPAEQAYLHTSHLVEPQPSVWWQKISQRFQQPHHSIHVSPVLTFLVGCGLSAVTLTGGALAIMQPRQPTLAESARQEVATALESAKAPSNFIADAQAAAPSPLPTPSPETLASPSPTAQLASALNSPEEKVYAYHVALAQGFLQKAIDLSQSTKNAQGEQEKQQILQSLEQALQAVNKAIEGDARQGAGFLVRARIYKTAAVVKPELNGKGDQDLTIARALGVNAALLGSDTSLLEYLPTQQATEMAGLPVVADAEEGNTTTVVDTSAGNAEQGRITMLAHSESLQVSFPGLKPTHSLRVNPVDPALNRANILFSITKRQDGQGFTIQSSQPLSENLELEWRAIDQ